MTRLAIVVVFSLLLVPAIASAQGEDNGASDETVYDFDVDDIGGVSQVPTGIYVTGYPTRQRMTLIEVRSDFVPEILRSAETL